MKKALNVLMALIILGSLLLAGMAVSSPAVNEEAADRYMEHSFADLDE